LLYAVAMLRMLQVTVLGMFVGVMSAAMTAPTRDVRPMANHITNVTIASGMVAHVTITDVVPQHQWFRRLDNGASIDGAVIETVRADDGGTELLLIRTAR
jgi:nucleoside phosphorylase